MAKHAVSIKTPEEIELLAEGGGILRTVLEDVARLAVPGATGRMLDTAAEKRLRDHGGSPSFKGYSPNGKPKDAFPAALCVSVNSAVVHGIPTDEPFQDGDVVSLDLGFYYKNLYTDTATTVVVGKSSPEKDQLLSVTKQALQAGIDQVRPGATTGDIGAAIQNIIESANLSIVRDLVGHGVGYHIHEEPGVPNVGKAGSGTKLMEGMVIAIEPMVVLGDHAVTVADDGWTIVTQDRMLASHEERTVAVTADGVRILTKV